MADQKNILKWLKIFLYLYALHSFAVALGLMFLPPEFFSIFGFEGCQESFFKSQAGVFHLVMAVAYIIAAKNIETSYNLIWFIISAKSIALVFLASYFVLFDRVWMIAISGIGDGAMAILLYILFRQYLKLNLSVKN